MKSLFQCLGMRFRGSFLCVFTICLYGTGCHVYEDGVHRTAKDSDQRAIDTNTSSFEVPRLPVAGPSLSSSDVVRDGDHIGSAGGAQPGAKSTSQPATAGMQAPLTALQGTDDDAGAANVAVSLPRLVAKVSPACRGLVGYVSDDNSHCYFALDASVSWHMARDHCVEADAHLATITSAEESAWVARFEVASELWIGLSRFGASDFSWLTNEAFSFTNWEEGAPHSLPESAVLIGVSGALWSDRSPNEAHAALCEL